MEDQGTDQSDELLITAILEWEPLSGSPAFLDSGSLRVLKYASNSSGKELGVYYVFFPHADVDLRAKDVAIVFTVAELKMHPGAGFEPEGIVRILEMLAELTRYVLG